MEKNEIVYAKDGEARTFAGPKAVDVFRIATLRSALGMLLRGLTPTRGFTFKKGLRMAQEYTGKVYKRSQTQDAINDLGALFIERRDAIPQRVEGSQDLVKRYADGVTERHL